MQILRSGDVVRVRRQRWRIRSVRWHRDCQLVALTGIGALNAGIERSVIAPFDVVEPAESRRRLRFVPPRGWRRACRALISQHGPPDRLLTAGRARIELLPFQLEPAIALLRGLASRILIADEVGLGKTIQAGLALAELRERGAADRALILTPAGLRDQWRDELLGRFALDSHVVDAREVRRRKRAVVVGHNPWATFPVAVSSLDYVKRPEVLPAVAACRWDIVIVDEAHAATPATDRYEAACRLCRMAAYVLLLTATPHNGEPDAYAALRDIGAIAQQAPMVFRRTRAAVGIGVRRRVHRHLVGLGPAEQTMHAQLAAFAGILRRERGDEHDASLALVTLHKRALSSPWSLARSVTRRLQRLDDATPGTHFQWPLPFDADGEHDPADEAPEWTGPGLNDSSREKILLESLLAASNEAVRHDSKLRTLAGLLRRLRRLGERAIVFTEYRDTLLYVQARLGLDCAVIHGGMDRDERRAALRAFCSRPGAVLLATDAAGEGLNLQDACRVVINLELPWNPVRLEQRAGRVDRIGQRHTVHVFHLIARASAETQMVNRLAARIARARLDIDVPDPLELVEGRGKDAPGDDSSMSHPELADAAAKEHQRLLLVRRVCRVHLDRQDVPMTVDSVWTFSKHSMTRARFGRRVLLLFESALEDLGGRRIAAHLTPVLLSLDESLAHRWRDSTADTWKELEQAVVGKIESEHSSFRRSAGEIHRAFWAARSERELAIAHDIGSMRIASFQPGLFDGRAARKHKDLEDLHYAVLHDAEDRARLNRRASGARPVPTRLALILLP